MKNEKKLVVVVLALLAFIVLPNYASSRIETDEDGKTMHSKKKISRRDFYEGNFFIGEIGDSSFNVKIFDMMKNLISNGTAKYLTANEELNEACKAFVKKGEIITWFNSSNYKNERLIVYYIFDKKSKHFIIYNFVLSIKEKQYNSYAESLKTLTSLIAECDKNIDLCDKNINSCNEIIERCSPQTIQKSRVVSVPIPTEPIINYKLGTAGNPGTEIELIEMPTRYVKKTEYYTVPNPNYNPNAVSKAKKDLQSWNNSKVSWTNKKNAAYEEKRNFPLPFVLEWYMPDFDSK